MTHKIVSNADAGDADTFGGDDLDNLTTDLETPSGPSYVAYRAGSLTKVRDMGVQETVSSNSSSYTAIQNVLTTITSAMGKKLYIAPGDYSLSNTLIPVQNSAVHIEGEAQNGYSRLIAAGNFPAIQIYGSFNTLENLYLYHNQATYTTGLLNITGGTDNTFKSLRFHDNFQRAASGSAISMNNTATASIYRNNFFQIYTEGFESAIAVTAEAFATASRFINRNTFNTCNFNVPKRVLKVTAASVGHFDDNYFVNCYEQCYASSLDAWDYETGNSGRNLYTVHSNCFIDDLPAGKKYALLGAATQIYLHGCYPAWLLGGAGTRRKVDDFYTTTRGKSTQSGDGTTAAFNIAHGLQVAPATVRVKEGSVDALGPYYATSDATNITVTYPIPPISGTNNLVWNWEANTF